MSIALGQIVVSKAGRDAGKKFIILKIIDDTYVQISDGNLRRVEKPKKKKIKHLEITGEVAETIEEKLRKNAKLTNPELRKVLAGVSYSPDGRK